MSEDSIYNLLAGIKEEIGGLKASSINVEKRMDSLNTKVKKNSEKINRFDIIFGKIGVIVSIIAFGVAFAFNLVADWVKTKFVA